MVPNLKNPPLLSSPKVILRDFPCKFLQIHITSVSGSLHFTFKICQTVAGTSTISQFHEFFNLIFGRFLTFDPTVSRRSFVRFVHIVSGLFCFASTVVPQQLSQKAFEKLATNQDLSNAIEKVSKDDDVDFYGSSLLPW